MDDKLRGLLIEDKATAALNDSSSFISWMQNFSKKIVTVFSAVYIIVVVIMIIMLSVELHIGYSEGIATMISEINETFRVVIGGYLIKSTVENATKIGGDFLAVLNKSKLKANKEQYEFEAAVNPDLDYGFDEEIEDSGDA